MRTGAVTALGARHLARRDARVLGHIGSRGTAYWNVRLLARVLRPRGRARALAPLREPRGLRRPPGRGARPLEVVAVDDWESCVRGADVVVEASRLRAPEPLLRTAWIEPGSLVVPYGTMSAVELDLLDRMDKVVVDDWGQAGAGPFGALRRHVDQGLLTRETLHAELGEIVAGRRPGRESPDETILFWHRGLSTTDVALGHALVEKARRLGVGQTLRFA